MATSAAGNEAAREEKPGGGGSTLVGGECALWGIIAVLVVSLLFASVWACVVSLMSHGRKKARRRPARDQEEGGSGEERKLKRGEGRGKEPKKRRTARESEGESATEG